MLRRKMNAKNLMLAVIAALAPIKPIIITVGVLIIVDLITGVWAAYKQGKPISSAALRRTVSKLAVYQMAIISGFLLQHYLIADLIPVVNIVAGVIGLVEFKSMLENSSKILGADVFKLILAKLGSQNDTLGDEARKLLAETQPAVDAENEVKK